MLTARLTLSSHVYSSDVLTDLYGCVQLAGFLANYEPDPDLTDYSSDVPTDLYGCVQLAGFHANCEANPDLTCEQQ